MYIYNKGFILYHLSLVASAQAWNITKTFCARNGAESWNSVSHVELCLVECETRKANWWVTCTSCTWISIIYIYTYMYIIIEEYIIDYIYYTINNYNVYISCSVADPPKIPICFNHRSHVVFLEQPRPRLGHSKPSIQERKPHLGEEFI